MPFIKDPSSKSDLIDRLLSQAFTGDLRDLAADPSTVEISRPKPHMISIKIAGREFLLAAHKPKPAKAIEAARKAYQARMERITGGRKVPASKTATTPPLLPKGEEKGGTGRYASTTGRGRRR